MSFRTNPDRILDHIDRQRTRDIHATHFAHSATSRQLDSEVPEVGSTPTERTRRIFGLVEKGYMEVAQSADIKRLAARFQAVGDINAHHARGDVSVSIQYMDAERHDDIGVVPFEIVAADLEEARKATRTSRPDANALKVLRMNLRDGVMAAYKKVEPRIRDAIRERADLGHIAVQVTIDVRPAD